MAAGPKNFASSIGTAVEFDRPPFLTPAYVVTVHLRALSGPCDTVVVELSVTEGVPLVEILGVEDVVSDIEEEAVCVTVLLDVGVGLNVLDGVSEGDDVSDAAAEPIAVREVVAARELIAVSELNTVAETPAVLLHVAADPDTLALTAAETLAPALADTVPLNAVEALVIILTLSRALRLSAPLALGDADAAADLDDAPHSTGPSAKPP